MTNAPIRGHLASSRRNNGMDGVSGILWIGDGEYRQLLEGPADSVHETLSRIMATPAMRHPILDDRMTDGPAFGEWAMAGLPAIGRRTLRAAPPAPQRGPDHPSVLSGRLRDRRGGCPLASVILRRYRAGPKG